MAIFKFGRIFSVFFASSYFTSNESSSSLVLALSILVCQLFSFFECFMPVRFQTEELESLQD